MNIIEKSWGYEEIIVNNDMYCGKRLTVFQNKGCGFHYHIKKHETFFVVEGAIKLIIRRLIDSSSPKDVSMILNAGSITTILQNTMHRFIGLEPVNRFMEFSTHDDPEDSIRI